MLEYALDKEDIVNEFARILKPEGKLSIVKHNRSGRVMQMVVLLNDFERAHRDCVFSSFNYRKDSFIK